MTSKYVWLSWKNMADEKVNSSGWRSHWDLTRRQFPTKTRKAFRHNLFSQLVVTQNIRLSLERLVPYRRDSSRYHSFSQIVKSIENETILKQQMKHCNIDKSCLKLSLGKVISVFDNVLTSNYMHAFINIEKSGDHWQTHRQALKDRDTQLRRSGALVACNAIYL